MKNFIKSIRIKKLFDEKEVNWELKKINVLVGKNGLGKSTILRLINSTIAREDHDVLDLCEEISIDMQDGRQYTSRNRNKMNFEAWNEMLKELMESNRIIRGHKSSIQERITNNKSEEEYVTKFTLELFDKINARALNSEENTSNKFFIDKSLSKNKNKKKKVEVWSEEEIDEKSEEKMKVEFISTINMSANSVNDITTSSGSKTTFLDLEIDNEIKRLNKNEKNKKELQNRLTNALNNLFEETNKKTVFNEDEIEIRLSSGKAISYRSLSSGERQVVFIFLKIINGSVDNSLILMDEPEISLHLSWQEKLLTEITKLNDTSQIIIVTHSPAMVMNGWLDSFVDIKNITTEA